jgi:hypothetical protein
MSRSNKESRPRQTCDGGGKVKKGKLSQQNLRNPANRVKTKEMGMAKTMPRLRRSTRDYSEGTEPSGDTGNIPLVRGGESGGFIDADGKWVRYADKPKGAMLKKFKKRGRK